MRNIVVRFDMRNSPACLDTATDRYLATLDMASWSDDHEVDVIGLSEHHGTSDGFLSAPLQLAGMMIARTQRVRISVSALLVPLHNPLKLAEDISLIDQVANGRFSVTCGLGYRESEYNLFGVDWSKRGKILDENLDILLQALKGEDFYSNGYLTVLNPAPISAIQSLILIGGNSKAAALRAARLGLLFSPAIDDIKLEQIYIDACQKNGVKYGFTISPGEPSTTFISQDPDKCWKDISQYLMFDAKSYGAWHHPNRRAYAESFATSIDELKKEGKYRVLSPEQALTAIEKTGSLHLAPLTGGVPIDVGWTSLRLFEDHVQPYL
ncbi:MAG: LLM class flavin-dependent oxidoreductase [Halioglobus sp.]|nr:LLM class flavin-dependent oxidoreductase [Halioglobus sp.]